jgi:topoisomerase-4 subunit A
MVKRFLIETTTQDKEFGFISESIGSRLVLVTTSDTPEAEVVLIKGKEKEKSSEVLNLEDLIDIKGWKAIGNRLSQFKVSAVKLVQEQEETGLEEGDDDNELLEVAESEKDSQSLKKKEPESQPSGQWIDEGEQASLFGEAEKPAPNQAPSHQQKSQPSKKIKVEQANLFESKPPKKQNESEEEQEVNERLTGVGSLRGRDADDDKEDLSFGVGETVELDL